MYYLTVQPRLDGQVVLIEIKKSIYIYDRPA